jgi:hypothetical protein
LLKGDEITIQVVVEIAEYDTIEALAIAVKYQLANLTGADADQFQVTIDVQTDKNGEESLVATVTLISSTEIAAAELEEAMILSPTFQVIDVDVEPDPDDSDAEPQEPVMSTLLILTLIVAVVVMVLGVAFAIFRSKRTVFVNEKGEKFTVPV